MLPAGAVLYLIRLNWLGTAVWVPCIISAFLVSLIVSFAKPAAEERLWPYLAPSLVAMHIIGGATLALLASIAIPAVTVRNELLPILEWLRPQSLAVLVLADLATLALMGRRLSKR